MTGFSLETHRTRSRISLNGDFLFADDGNDAVDVRGEGQPQRAARSDNRAWGRRYRQEQRKYSTMINARIKQAVGLIDRTQEALLW